MKAKLIFLLLSLTGIINVSSCRKEPPNEMPPETQTGANTLGCLIDGELFVGGCCAPWMHPIFSVGYYTISDKLRIGAYGKMNDQASGGIYIEIDTPRENVLQKFSIASYNPSTGRCIRYEAFNDGICTITKFDTIRKIVSGQFQFIGYCGGIDSTDTRQITQGRFDFKYDTYNE